MNHHYDIIIVGGGMVGLACAHALANTSLRIAILERHEKPVGLTEHKDDGRVCAINQASQHLFKQWGIWQTLLDNGAAAYQAMQVWDAHSSGKLSFSAPMIPMDELGHIIENRVISHSLRTHLPNAISTHYQCELASYDALQQRLLAVNGHAYHAKLFIAADGGQSWLRRQADITVKQTPYQQQAIVASIKAEQPHQATAYQRFLTTGPLALLPLSSPHHCSIVWSAKQAEAERLLGLSDSTFNQALTQASEMRLGQLCLQSSRRHFPLQNLQAAQYVKNGVVLIGDAAHVVHPLAGQGVNLGFADADCLARCIQAALMNKRDFSAHTNLRKFERERKADNYRMALAMRGLNGLFGNTMPLLQKIRGCGLNLVDRTSLVKSLFLQTAQGHYILK